MFTSGAHFPSNDRIPDVCEACTKEKKRDSHQPFDEKEHEGCRTGALEAHKLYFKERDKPLVNKTGLEDKERVGAKTQKIMRSRSPTLRKTETHDIYRTFVDIPEGLTAGAAVFTNDQVFSHEDTQREGT